MPRYLCAAVALALLAVPARAGFIVTVTNATLTPGSPVTVDIRVRSGAGDGPLDTLNFGIDAVVEPIAGAGNLRFTNPQDDATFTFSNSNYVFFGNSQVENFSASLGLVQTSVTLDDFFVGSDSADNSSPTAVTNTGRLLARLELYFPGTATPGDSYRVRVRNTADTFFEDGDLNLQSIDAFEAGTVTVVGAPAVATPAPAGLLIGVFGAGVLGLARRRDVRCFAPTRAC